MHIIISRLSDFSFKKIVIKFSQFCKSHTMRAQDINYQLYCKLEPDTENEL